MKDAFFALVGSYPRIAETQRQLMGTEHSERYPANRVSFDFPTYLGKIERTLLAGYRTDNIEDKVFKKNSRTP